MLDARGGLGDAGDADGDEQAGEHGADRQHGGQCSASRRRRPQPTADEQHQGDEGDAGENDVVQTAEDRVGRRAAEDLGCIGGTSPKGLAGTSGAAGLEDRAQRQGPEACQADDGTVDGADDHPLSA